MMDPQALVKAGLIDRSRLSCPLHRGRASYFVVCWPRQDAPRPDANMVVMYEDAANHRGDGGNVLYQDGRARFEKTPRLNEIINSIPPQRRVRVTP